MASNTENFNYEILNKDLCSKFLDDRFWENLTYDEYDDHHELFNQESKKVMDFVFKDPSKRTLKHLINFITSDKILVVLFNNLYIHHKFGGYEGYGYIEIINVHYEYYCMDFPKDEWGTFRNWDYDYTDEQLKLGNEWYKYNSQ